MFFRTNLKYGLLQGMFWMMNCVMFPFIVQIYRDYGYDEMLIGVIAMCASGVNVLSQPIWGKICDRSPKIKKIFIIALLAGIVGSLILPLGRIGPAITVVSVLILNASVMPLSGIIDAWILRMNASGYRIDYGFTRSFGSVFYAVTAAFFGYLLDGIGLWLTTPAFIGCAVVLALVALSVKEPTPVEESEEGRRVEQVRAKEPFFSGIQKLAKNSRYLIAILCCMLMSMGLGGASLFFPIKMAELGAGNGEYGVSLFVQAITEIFPLLLYTRLSRRFQSETLLAAAIGFTSIKVLCMGAAPSVPLAIASQALQAISYGLYLGAIASYIPKVVEKEQLFTAQTLLGAWLGIASMLSNLLGGWVSSMFGVAQMTVMAAVLPALGCAVFLAFQIFYRKKQEMIQKNEAIQ